jgi:hypothetical protein
MAMNRYILAIYNCKRLDKKAKRAKHKKQAVSVEFLSANSSRNPKNS